MVITLEYDEVRQALLKAVEEKTQYIFGAAMEDSSYFDVAAHGGKEIEDIESVKFSVIFE